MISGLTVQLKSVRRELRIGNFVNSKFRIGAHAGIHVVDDFDERQDVDDVQIDAPTGVIDSPDTSTSNEPIDGLAINVFVGQGTDVEIHGLEI